MRMTVVFSRHHGGRVKRWRFLFRRLRCRLSGHDTHLGDTRTFHALDPEQQAIDVHLVTDQGYMPDVMEDKPAHGIELVGLKLYIKMLFDLVKRNTAIVDILVRPHLLNVLRLTGV